MVVRWDLANQRRRQVVRSRDISYLNDMSRRLSP